MQQWAGSLLWQLVRGKLEFGFSDFTDIEKSYLRMCSLNHFMEVLQEYRASGMLLSPCATKAADLLGSTHNDVSAATGGLCCYMGQSEKSSRVA